MLMHSQPA